MRYTLISALLLFSCNFKSGNGSDKIEYNKALLRVSKLNKDKLTINEVIFMDSIYNTLDSKPKYHFDNMASILITNRKFNEFNIYYKMHKDYFVDHNSYLIAISIYMSDKILGTKLIEKASRIIECDSNSIKATYCVSRIIYNEHNFVVDKIKDKCNQDLYYLERYKLMKPDELINELLPQ